MAVDIKKLFNEELPGALAKNAETAKRHRREVPDEHHRRGVASGSSTVTASPKAEAGTRAARTARSTIAAEDFQKLVENPQANGMQLFFAGKLKVAGNQMLAMKLQKLFELAD